MERNMEIPQQEQLGFVPEVQPVAKKMTKERVHKAMQTLEKYKAGKARLDARLVEVE